MPATSWGDTLSGPPILDCALPQLTPVVVRRWRDIAPDIVQHALEQHFISVHLGGPKQLTRRGEGATSIRDVSEGDHSVVPAGAAYDWTTVGPVDFAHVYVAPEVLNTLISHTFDRDPARITLHEGLGAADPLIRSLTLALLKELQAGDACRAYLDDMVHLMLSRMLSLHSDVKLSTAYAKHSLAPFRLRRALDFIEANLDRPIGVREIAAASGISPYHFSRAFRQTTGLPPYAFLLERRVARAKSLLRSCDLKLGGIARQCGFTSLSQFSRMFRHHVGSTPTRYRADF